MTYFLPTFWPSTYILTVDSHSHTASVTHCHPLSLTATHCHPLSSTVTLPSLHPPCTLRTLPAPFTLSSHSLHTLFALSLHSLCTLFALSLHSLHTLFTISSQSLYTLFTLSPWHPMAPTGTHLACMRPAVVFFTFLHQSCDFSLVSLSLWWW